MANPLREAVIAGKGAAAFPIRPRVDTSETVLREETSLPASADVAIEAPGVAGLLLAASTLEANAAIVDLTAYAGLMAARRSLELLGDRAEEGSP